MINLFVDIHCREEAWAYELGSTNYKKPVYRLYLNNELLTERTWIYSDDLVREEIWVDIPRGFESTINLVPVMFDDKQATFGLDNLHADNFEVTVTWRNQHTITFYLH